jgi:hypothetical protein
MLGEELMKSDGQNGQGSLLEGWKYSGSRIGLFLAVFGELRAFP